MTYLYLHIYTDPIWDCFFRALSRSGVERRRYEHEVYSFTKGNLKLVPRRETLAPSLMTQKKKKERYQT